MSASTILTSTILLVLAVVAIALLAGSLAMLLGRKDRGEPGGGSVIEAFKALDRQWRIERLVYRHHRAFGAATVGASMFCIWQLMHSSASRLLVQAGISGTLIWTLLAGLIVSVLVGLVILGRPSLLKPVESVGNRWHHLALDSEHRPQSARLTAAILALVGLTVLIGSGALLLHQWSVLVP